MSLALLMMIIIILQMESQHCKPGQLEMIALPPLSECLGS